MDNKGQSSLELILIIAAVLSVAALLILNLGATSKSGTDLFESTSKKAVSNIEKIK